MSINYVFLSTEIKICVSLTDKLSNAPIHKYWIQSLNHPLQPPRDRLPHLRLGDPLLLRALRDRAQDVGAARVLQEPGRLHRRHQDAPGRPHLRRQPIQVSSGANFEFGLVQQLQGAATAHGEGLVVFIFASYVTFVVAAPCTGFKH